MADRLDVCLLWHMHQPCYHDSATGVSSLPWVRLHATKAYFDMAEACARAPENVRSTVNFVPVLLDQLAGYGDGRIKDHFLELSRKPADGLTHDDAVFVLRYFFMANWETMVKPHARYWALLLKRGMDRASWDLDAGAKRFTADELRDLQVWFNLAWFGWAAKEKYPVVAEMIAKGSKFTEADKEAVLQAQLDCINAIVPAWRKLAEAGRVELTATPFYHPILPLLVNTRHAQRAMPDVALPDDFIAPEDAEAQVRRAVAFHERTWGRKPDGMWPAEGSVSPEVVPLFRRAGVRWIATDEDVLFASLGRRDRERDLFRPWRYSHGAEEISIFFRDRVLSDLVGFTYSKMQPQDAANDFLGRVHGIKGHAHGNAVASVILDGENPWEYYPDGGKGFLARLYEGLGSASGIRANTFTRALEESRPEPLPHLHSGSWISSNYRIWIGHHEDNTGWNLLKRAREDLRAKIRGPHPPSPEQVDAAMDNLYRAEGSDWFWWFGDDFTSDNDAEFDRLFRTHISNAYRAAGLEPPAQLAQAISKAAILGVSTGARAPVNFIHPKIDGRADSYFEWKGAGYYSVGKSEGAMHKGTAWIVGIHYGFDLESLFLRLDPVTTVAAGALPGGHAGEKPDRGDLRIEVSLIVRPAKETDGEQEFRVVFPFRPGVANWVLMGPRGGDQRNMLRDGKDIAYVRVCELKVPLSDLGVRPGGSIDFHARVYLEEVEVDRYPRNGSIRVDAPGKDFESENWWV